MGSCTMITRDTNVDGISFFDSDIVSLPRSIWMTPSFWFQHGYDLVVVSQEKPLVRFIQMKTDQRRQFEPSSFIVLLSNLAKMEIEVEELLFRIPRNLPDDCVLPVTEKKFH